MAALHAVQATVSIKAKETNLTLTTSEIQMSLQSLVVHSLFSRFLRKGSDQEYFSFRVCVGGYNSSFQQRGRK